MNLPQWFKEHIVCWYSPKRQGATNESLRADPRLIDLSGNGMDLELVNFSFSESSGINAEGNLQFDNKAYGRTIRFKGLPSFTYIAKREFNAAYNECLVAKSPKAYSGFVGETHQTNGERYVYVGTMGAEWLSESEMPSSLAVSYMTPHMLNGYDISDRVGTFVDTDSRLLVGLIREGGGNDFRHFGGTMHDFFFFDTELTQDQIDYVKNNLIE